MWGPGIPSSLGNEFSQSRFRVTYFNPLRFSNSESLPRNMLLFTTVASLWGDDYGVIRGHELWIDSNDVLWMKCWMMMILLEHVCENLRELRRFLVGHGSFAAETSGVIHHNPYSLATQTLKITPTPPPIPSPRFPIPENQRKRLIPYTLHAPPPKDPTQAPFARKLYITSIPFKGCCVAACHVWHCGVFLFG